MSRRRQRFWVIIGLALLFILAQFAFFAPARDLARQALAKPVLAVSTISTKISNTFLLIGSIRQLAKENSQLREQTVAQLAEIAELTNVKNENQQLRQDLNFNNLHPELSLQPATIISYSPIGSYQALTIDKGSQDGIIENQAVVSSGFLIGKIKNVAVSSAEVWLLTNRNLATPVILTGSQVTGILKGGIRGLVVDNIPVDTIIAPGELVVSSSLEGLYPAGLAIGQVEETISQKEEIFIALRISSPVNIANIRTVFVISNK
ncbi:MAG: rod shape-determining protein MreC [Patescibacteria group bacterium]